VAASPSEGRSSPTRRLRAGLALTGLIVVGLNATPCFAATDRDVAAATRCYASADLACVIERLQASTSQQPERWRLLAFAAARLDRHQLARQAFTAWIGLGDKNRLRRDVTAPAIWRDYAAALIAVHAGQLDLQPRVEPPAVLPPSAVTGTTLPRFAPPPRSDRDNNADFAIWLGGQTGVVWGPDDLWTGVELTVAANLSFRWRAGIQVSALRYPTEQPAVADKDALVVAGVWAGAALRADLLLLDGAAGELVAAGSVGYGVLDWDDGRSESMAAIRPALRYAWPARRGPGLLALWLEIGHGFLPGGSRDRHMDGVGFGIELRPGANRGARRTP
jgi:hypothetical protein